MRADAESGAEARAGRWSRGRPRGPLRLGFLGVGWIGRNRMEALARSGCAEVAALVDPCSDACSKASACAPGAAVYDGYEEMLDAELDGVVIATPSAGHAEQTTAALERGLPVFCQKPLGRNAPEVRAVLEAAARADRYLAVDFSYRYLEATEAVLRLVRSGALGRVYAADLCFHNAYGPDREWFYDPLRSGGGCVMDLGVHLVDLLLWITGFPAVVRVTSRLLAGGRPVRSRWRSIEDYAEIRLDLDGGVTGRISCSWNLHAGEDATVHFLVHGTEGSARVSNVGGSFYDFRALHLQGTSSRILVEPPDDWGGRAAIAWAKRIRRTGPAFDPSSRQLLDTARVLDAVYRTGVSGGEERPYEVDP